MNEHTWQETLDQLRAEHHAEIRTTIAGSTWVCSCGDRGMGVGAFGYAWASRARHLRAAHRRIIARYVKP